MVIYHTSYIIKHHNILHHAHHTSYIIHHTSYIIHHTSHHTYITLKHHNSHTHHTINSVTCDVNGNSFAFGCTRSTCVRVCVCLCMYVCMYYVLVCKCVYVCSCAHAFAYVWTVKDTQTHRKADIFVRMCGVCGVYVGVCLVWYEFLSMFDVWCMYEYDTCMMYDEWCMNAVLPC